MKKLFTWLVIGGIAYFGWLFYLKHQNETSLPIAHETPTPEVIAVATPAATPLKRLAPKGVFFVLQRLSTMTDSGVVSAVAGTKVTLVRDGSPMLVTDGQHQYDALASQLTNDMDIGEHLAQADQYAQARVKQQIFQTTQDYHAQRQEALKAEDASREKAVENNSKAETERQQKIAGLLQKIRDDRQAIRDYYPYRYSDGQIPLRAQHAEQKFIDQKQREILNLKNQLGALGVNATFE